MQVVIFSRFVKFLPNREPGIGCKPLSPIFSRPSYLVNIAEEIFIFILSARLLIIDLEHNLASLENVWQFHLWGALFKKRLDISYYLKIVSSIPEINVWQFIFRGCFFYLALRGE